MAIDPRIPIAMVGVALGYLGLYASTPDRDVMVKKFGKHLFLIMAFATIMVINFIVADTWSLALFIGTFGAWMVLFLMDAFIPFIEGIKKLMTSR